MHTLTAPTLEEFRNSAQRFDTGLGAEINVDTDPEHDSGWVYFDNLYIEDNGEGEDPCYLLLNREDYTGTREDLEVLLWAYGLDHCGWDRNPQNPRTWEQFTGDEDFMHEDTGGGCTAYTKTIDGVDFIIVSEDCMHTSPEGLQDARLYVADEPHRYQEITTENAAEKIMMRLKQGVDCD